MTNALDLPVRERNEQFFMSECNNYRTKLMHRRGGFVFLQLLPCSYQKEQLLFVGLIKQNRNADSSPVSRVPKIGWPAKAVLELISPSFTLQQQF